MAKPAAALSVAAAALLLAAARAQPPNATWASCCGPADVNCVRWTSMVFSPPAPVAGGTLMVNGTGIAAGPVSNSSQSTGAINAFLYGLNVFSAPLAACGQTVVDVLDVTTGTLDGLPCPVANGQKVALGFVLPIPDEAQGLGELVINLNTTDQTGNLIAWCLQVNATI